MRFPPNSRSTSRALRARAVILAALALGGCTGEFRQCNVNADCASGVCRPDGSCAPVGSNETPSGTNTPQPTGSSTPPPQQCTPNNDGQISEDEFVVATGVAVPYRVATDVTVSTTSQGGQWDLSGALPGDSTLGADLLDPAGEWFADSFPSASYAVRLSSTSNLLGVYEKDTSGLYLVGIASPSDGAGRTLLTYGTPIPMLQFPVSVGSNWSVTSDVTGDYEGNAVFGMSETYTLEADEAGTVITPVGSFDVLRVRAQLSRTVLATTTTVRTFAFTTECYGTVARIVSQEGEQTVEFTDAAEVWRLGQ